VCFVAAGKINALHKRASRGGHRCVVNLLLPWDADAVKQGACTAGMCLQSSCVSLMTVLWHLAQRHSRTVCKLTVLKLWSSMLYAWTQAICAGSLSGMRLSPGVITSSCPLV